MKGNFFTTYTIAVLLALIGINSSFTTRAMAQNSNPSQGVTENSTNSSTLNLSYKNVLKAARKSPVTIIGKGLFYSFSPLSRTMIDVDKVSIYIDENQAFITFITPKTQISRTKITFIGYLKEYKVGFTVNLQSTKFEHEVYHSESKQFRLDSESKVDALQFGSCSYINYDIVNNELGKFEGDLRCTTAISGRDLLGHTEVMNLPIGFNFSAIDRK